MRLNPGAAEQSAGPPAVRLDSVLREAAADYLRPSVLPARWLRPEEPRAEARGGPAYWEFPDRLAPVLTDVVRERAQSDVELRAEVQAEAAALLFLGMNVSPTPARAGADRKESGRAWAPAEQDAKESECRAAPPEVQPVVR